MKDSEPEDIDHLIFTECKKLMEASLLFRLSVGSQEQNSIFLWRPPVFGMLQTVQSDIKCNIVQ